jgi:WD40 repeat protein
VLYLWDASSGVLLLTLATLSGHSGYANAVAFSPDGKTLASSSLSGAVNLWDTGSGALLLTLSGHSHFINAIAFSLDGRMLASASTDGVINMWDVGLGALLFALTAQSVFITAVAFSPDGKMLGSALGDGTIKLWDAGSGGVLHTLEVGFSIQNFSFSNDGTFIWTNRGLLYSEFISSGTAFSDLGSSSSIFIGKQWVRRGIEDILWLPLEYRPRCIAVRGSVVWFGYESSRVLSIRFGF